MKMIEFHNDWLWQMFWRPQPWKTLSDYTLCTFGFNCIEWIWYLKERKDKADGEVRHPVKRSSHGVCGRTMGLLEELSCDQERNTR